MKPPVSPQILTYWKPTINVVDFLDPDNRATNVLRLLPLNATMPKYFYTSMVIQPEVLNHAQDHREALADYMKHLTRATLQELTDVLAAQSFVDSYANCFTKVAMFSHEQPTWSLMRGLDQ